MRGVDDGGGRMEKDRRRAAFACISWGLVLWSWRSFFCLWRSAMMILNALSGVWGALARLLFTWCSILS
ncbi:hypothetical protein K440DRAFT_75138 [Wilcoxina mikolae CBS 423.85]|nr:hypothetical protein K440DRAFT_75138 [Wilcoxina mikolae CBS 423.85]